MTFVGSVALTNQNSIKHHQGYSEQATKRIDDRIHDLTGRLWKLDGMPEEEAE
jgi:hypothetical protein